MLLHPDPMIATKELFVKDLLIKGVETTEEHRLALDLMSKVHMTDSFAALRWLETNSDAYPGFRREHTRIAVRKGEICAALRLTTDTLRIGEARLKMGGIGWVTTAGWHRDKGIARRLIQHSMQYLRDHNYHVSMLFGIPDFYHRFGFTTTLAEYGVIVPVREAAEVNHTPYRLRNGKPGDIPAIQRLHNNNDTQTACSIIRSAAHFSAKWKRWEDLQVITDEKGKVIAYLLPKQGEGEITLEETGVAGHAACAALLHACSRIATGQYAAQLRFLAPPPHPLMQFLMRHRSIHEMRITRNQDGMMAFVNLGETLESMIPEWESQLGLSAARALRTECTLILNRKPWRIRANRGAIDIGPFAGANKVSLSEAELMQLITGYRYLDEILAQHRRIITTEGRALLAALFPKRAPYVWHTDRF